jgi:Fe-S cluster biogenesis protein NfuA
MNFKPQIVIMSSTIMSIKEAYKQLKDACKIAECNASHMTDSDEIAEKLSHIVAELKSVKSTSTEPTKEAPKSSKKRKARESTELEVVSPLKDGGREKKDGKEKKSEKKKKRMKES